LPPPGPPVSERRRVTTSAMADTRAGVESAWEAPPLRPRTSLDEVHVWRAHIDVGGEHLAGFWSTLSEDERARAFRFHFETDRRRFVAARGFLRAILARYLKCAAGQLRFTYGANGKPALPATTAAAFALQFNLSHSDALALYAVASGREVGVDVERIRHDVAAEDIAGRFFSPREAACLRALPASARVEAFFNGWTRKEAYIKAKGTGLSLPLDSFDVSLPPGVQPALLRTSPDAAEADRWSLHALRPGAGFTAALVVAGRDAAVRCWHAEADGVGIAARP
jgi:4'-phosphopantetheinyl transferase